MADEIQVVTFRLGGHEFAFNVFDVERILRYEEPAPLPKTPEYFVGTLRQGDEVVPMVDLRERLGFAVSIDEGTRIVVVQFDGAKVGLVVDAVVEVLKVSVESVSPPPSIVRGLAAECIHGILTVDGRMVVVLAVSKLLGSDERIALGTLMAELSDE